MYDVYTWGHACVSVSLIPTVFRSVAMLVLHSNEQVLFAGMASVNPAQGVFNP